MEDELFDLSTMAMEYFKEHIEPTLPEITYFGADYLDFTSFSGTCKLKNDFTSFFFLSNFSYSIEIIVNKMCSTHYNILLIKVIIEKSRGEVSLVEQDTIENVS